MKKNFSELVKTLKKRDVNSQPEDFISNFKDSFVQLEKLGVGTYIYDYQHNYYHYISPIIFEILELDPEDLKQNGGASVFARMLPEDSSRVINLLQKTSIYFSKLSDSLIKKALCKHYYRVKTQSGQLQWIMQFNRMVKYGTGILDLGTITIASKEELDPPPYLLIEMGNLKKCIMPDGIFTGSTKLTNREEEVFFWSLRGVQITEIATRLNITEAGVKFHRKNILKKHNANTFDELKILAQNYAV